MCWSYEVSLAAAGAESICLLVLCIRRYKTDMRHALMLLPLVVQEWCQVILWVHIGSSPTQCDDTNRMWSGFVTYVICSIPAWFSLQPLFLRYSDLCHDNRRFVVFCSICATLAGTFGAMVHFIGTRGGLLDAVCTYAGPWHHQVWPVLHFQYVFLPGVRGRLVGYTLSSLNLTLYGMLSMGLFVGRLTYTTMGLPVSFLVAQLLVLVLGAEWGSFWCFTTSFLVFVAFLEPCFARYGWRDLPTIIDNVGPAVEGQSRAIGKTMDGEDSAPAVELDSESPELVVTMGVGAQRGEEDDELDTLL